MLVAMKPVSQAEQEALNRFGEAVRQAREGQGVSQEELAHRCGVSQAYVSGLEGGKRNPSLVSVLRVASGLRVSLELLFRGQEGGTP